MNIIYRGDDMDIKDLQVGDSGDLVKTLQEKLKIVGFYNALVTGIFGMATEVGVKAFQKEFGLDETGIVDRETWDLLLQLTDVAVPYSNQPRLSLGSTGSDVRQLQLKLRALLYYMGPISANFDLQTENAVKRLQFNNDLTTNGVVDSATWNLIDILYGNLNECVLNEVGNGESDSSSTYVVKPGDTLYAIARRYNTSVDTLMRLNNLTSNVLQVGQVLRVPSSSDNGTSTITYTVRPGDTLYAIASRYNTTVNEIQRLNNLTSNVLQVGQVLQIPSSGSNGGGGSSITYVVKPGDTLYAIASRYNTTVNEIQRFNNLTSTVLSIGQVLQIPSSSNNYITYVVQRGDTLFSIASRYNTTVDAIMRLNNLTSNVLSIGQVLRIGI